MQTYGLKVGDKVTLNEKAGISEIGYYDYCEFEPINPPAWGDMEFVIRAFEFHNGATFAVVEDNFCFIATEVKKVVEKSIEDVKVGDYVVILDAKWNFNSEMRKLVGKVVQVTSVEYKTSHGTRIKFACDGGWVWETENNHFRYATKEEISKGFAAGMIPPKEIYFGETLITIVPGSGKAYVKGYGEVTSEELRSLETSLRTSDKRLFGYNPTVALADTTQIAFGCQRDTYAKLLEIMAVMNGNG